MAAHFFGRWSSSLLKRWNFQVPAIVFWVEEPFVSLLKPKNTGFENSSLSFFFWHFFQQSNKKDLSRLQIPGLIMVPWVEVEQKIESQITTVGYANKHITGSLKTSPPTSLC